MSSTAHTRARRERLRNTEPPYHGTPTIYNDYGCRCDLCRTAYSASRKARKDAAGVKPKVISRVQAELDALNLAPRQPLPVGLRRTRSGFPVAHRRVPD